MPQSSTAAIPRFALIAAIIIPALIGVVLAMMLRASGEAQVVTVLDTPRPLPSVALTTGDGDTADVSAASDTWRLMFFGFTHCPDICPATLAEMSALRNGSSTLQRGLQLEFVTVDPARDDAATMRKYTDYFDPTIRTWTGELDAIRTLTDAAGIAFLKVPLDGDGYTMDHSAALVLINPAGAIAGYVLPPWDRERLQADLEGLVG